MLAAAGALAEQLKDVVRIKLDAREEYSPGWKYNEWEMKGVPVRIELGPRDLEKNQAVLVRRDSGAKEAVPLGELPVRLPLLLEEIQQDMLAAARAFREAHTHSGSDYKHFSAVMEKERGLYLAAWCGREECELKAKNDTKATIRCIPMGVTSEHARCLVCGEKATETVYFARSY